MNDNKTEYLSVVPKSAAVLIDGSVISLGDFTITASESVHSVGVVIDRHLGFKKQTLSVYAHSTSAILTR